MLLQVVSGLFMMMAFVACDEENEVYSNPNILDTDIALTYQQMETYPFEIVMTSEQPSYTMSNSVYAFSILEVQLHDQKLEEGGGNFEIDPENGVITVDNTNGFLKVNESYAVNVGVANVNGMIVNEKAFTVTVLDIPMAYTIDTETATTNYLENVDVATITFQDTSENADVLEGISYSLFDAPEGFSIDETTGVISKTSDATAGIHNLTVIIASNLGAVTFENVLAVTVGEAPVLGYLQQDGSTTLASVLMSPWSTYTSQIPVIEGMEAVSFELVLPATINASDVTVNAEGIITVSPVDAISEGTHSIGVVATNASDVSATFNAVFELVVEAKWEETPVFSEDFNAATIESATVGAYNDKLSTYSLNGTPLLFDVIHISAKNYFASRLAVSKPASYEPIDAALVLELELQSTWKKMRVSFSEGFGYAPNRLESFHRTFQTSNTIDDLLEGEFVAGNWSNTINFDDAAWSTGDSWKVTDGDVSLNTIVKNIEFDASSPSVFLNWRIEKYAELTKAGGSAFLIDAIKVEVAASYEAIEQ